MGHHSSNTTLEDKKLRSEPHPIFGIEEMESSLPYHHQKILILIYRSFIAIRSKFQKHLFLLYENLNTNDSFNESKFEIACKIYSSMNYSFDSYTMINVDSTLPHLVHISLGIIMLILLADYFCITLLSIKGYFALFTTCNIMTLFTLIQVFEKSFQFK